MMKHVISIALILVILGSFAARSEELGRAVFQFYIGSCTGRERILIAELLGGCYYIPDYGPVCCRCSFWLDSWLTTADVGTTLTATPAMDPCFSTLVWTLTNNQNDYFGVAVYMESYNSPGKFGCGIRTVDYEKAAFSLDSNDFYGATITSIAIRLDSLSFEVGTTSSMLTAHVTLSWIIEGAWNNTPVEPATWSRIKRLFCQ